ncbi:MAG: hypothetical protein AAGC46_16665, partial [Solirubrobacteraceae bacterium]
MPVSRQLASEFKLHRDDLIEAWHPATTIGEPRRGAVAGGRAFAVGRRAAGTRVRAHGRSRLAAATTVLAAALSLTTAAPVDAASGWCSPSGDYCTSVAKRGGVRTLSISTFSFRGDVDFCVQAPGGEDPVCRTRTLKAGSGKSADLYS